MSYVCILRKWNKVHRIVLRIAHANPNSVVNLIKFISYLHFFLPISMFWSCYISATSYGEHVTYMYIKRNINYFQRAVTYGCVTRFNFLNKQNYILGWYVSVLGSGGGGCRMAAGKQHNYIGSLNACMQIWHCFHSWLITQFFLNTCFSLYWYQYFQCKEE